MFYELINTIVIGGLKLLEKSDKRYASKKAEETNKTVPLVVASAVVELLKRNDELKEYKRGRKKKSTQDSTRDH